jgi:hypothetical protein
MLVASPVLKKWAHGASDTGPVEEPAAVADGERQAVS